MKKSLMIILAAAATSAALPFGAWGADPVGGPYVAKIGDSNYSTLTEAFAAANEAGTATIVMLESLGSTDYTIVQDNPRLYAIDAALTNVSVTVAKTSNITLDLNGKTISAVDNTGKNFAFIDNKGTFTVTDSSANADGVLCYGSMTPDGSFGYGNYTIYNTGTVTVERGKVMNNVRYTRAGSTPGNLTCGASYAINTFAVGADSWVYIKGGEVYNWATAAMRAFGSDSRTSHIVITGGEVAGYPGIWLQNPSSAPTSAAKMTLQIDGGQVSHTSASGPYDAIMSTTEGALLNNVAITINGGTINGYVDVGDKDLESSETVTITGGTFLTEDAIDCYAPNNSEIGKIQISGGTFATRVPEKYCAEDYRPTDEDPVTHLFTVTRDVPSVTFAVPTTNMFGAVKITGNVASNLYVAVPFEGFEADGALRKAQDVVHPANLMAGAKLFAYDKANDRYNVYESESGAWKSANKVTVDAEGKAVVETADLGYGIPAGTGAILERKSTSEAVYVYGQVPMALAESVTFGAGQTLVSPPYTNATVEVSGAKYVDLNSFTWTGVRATGKKRLVNLAGADYIQFRTAENKLVKYYYLQGEGWGVVPTQVASFANLVANKKALVPAGTAFWYYSNAGGAKVEWKK